VPFGRARHQRADRHSRRAAPTPAVETTPVETRSPTISPQQSASTSDAVHATHLRDGERHEFVQINPQFLQLESWERSVMKSVFHFIASPRAASRTTR